MATDSNNGGEERRTYTTSRGYEVEFLSIPNLMVKLTAQFPDPPAPTYTVELAGGGTETHVHDETTLETEEDRAAWTAYKTAVAKHTADVFQAQMRLCLLRGIKVLNEDPHAVAAWVTEQELIGFTIPTEPSARRLHWLETEVVNNGEDFIQILAGVSRASGIAEEAVSSLESSFRSALGRSQRTTANRTPDTSNGRTLVDNKSIRTNGHGNQKRHPKAVGVGRAVTR